MILTSSHSLSLPRATRRFATKANLSALLSLLVLVLAACGGTTSTPTRNASGHGGTLTIVDLPKGDFTSNFNPFINSQTSRYGTQGFLYETLLYVNRYDGSTTPWLATSYSVSSDQTSITFHLRPNVKWSDGQAFTSDDVVYTLNAFKQYPALDTSGLWAVNSPLLKDVSAPDASTVVVTLAHPSSTALWYIGGQTFIAPKHTFSSAGDLSKFTNDAPVSTGPFTLKSFSPQLFVYTRNPNYWQPGKPAIDQIRLPALDSNTSANLLLSRGDIDWAGVGYDPKLNPIFTGRDSHNQTWFPASNVVTLYLNLTKAPFNLLPVRQAISLAINRQELQAKAAPYAPPASPTALLLPANKDYLSPTYQSSTFTVDTAKAESLMQSAGYTKGSDGIYADSHGNKISFTLNVVNGWSDWQSDTQLITQDLKAIGMDVKINTQAAFAPYLSSLQTGDFDAAISWTNPGPTPYYLYDSMLASSNTATIGQSATSNFERWKDATTDTLLNQYATSGDPATQKQAIDGLQKIMVDQLPTIPLTNNPYWDEFSTKRFVGWPDAKNPYAVPSPTNYPDNEYIVLHLKQA